MFVVVLLTLPVVLALTYDNLFQCRNGGYETSPLSGRYCGSNLPPLTVSHGNQMWIKFSTDGSARSTGFHLVYDGTTTGELLANIPVSQFWTGRHHCLSSGNILNM